MNKSKMIKWLQSLKKDIGQSHHQDLWHYAEMLDEVIGTIEVSEDCSDYYKGYCSKYDDGCLHQCMQKQVSEDAVDRADLFEKMQSLCPETDKGCGDCHKACDIEDCLDFVMDAPSVIPQPKEGEWIDRDGWKFCSECDNRADKQANGVEIEPLCTNYCPNCGAKMRLE